MKKLFIATLFAALVAACCGPVNTNTVKGSTNDSIVVDSVIDTTMPVDTTVECM